MTQRILVTSALPYVNGIKHLGNLAGSLLPADAYARYHRLRGRDVLFVCGTDEHGTPAELAAAKAGLPVAAFCAQQHQVQADSYRDFGIQFDHFGRTSSPANHRLTQAVFLALERAGLVAEKDLILPWSQTDGRFLPDRYVLGTCPKCGAADARGDQCDACGSLLEPNELIRPRSAVSGAQDIELRPSRHLFLKLPELRERVKTWLAGKADWDPLVLGIAHAWLADGFQERCITRDLSWGVPVPKRGFEGKSFYVWFDAPIAYLALVQEWAGREGRDWREWLAADAKVHWTQFLAKDNVAFHAVWFPATLLGARQGGLGFRLADRIKGFNWLTWGEEKFSTSAGRGIFVDQAVREHPADVWRWWLLANAPEGGDTRFTRELFTAGVDADLANGIGNLANRLVKFTHARFGGHVPAAGIPGEREERLALELQSLLDGLAGHYEGCEFRKACGAIRSIWSLADRYVAQAAPWSSWKAEPDEAALSLRVALNLLRVGAQVASPVIPFASARILESLGSEGLEWPASREAIHSTGGTPVRPLEPLFPRLAAQT